MLVPNDVYCSDSTAFQILQGPKLVLYFQYTPADTSNSMSGRLPTAAIILSLSIHPNAAGKSTQIGLLTIMAQCWLFVPAEMQVFGEPFA
jgi:ABC-type uncharacterized transport system ATPase subunit